MKKSVPGEAQSAFRGSVMNGGWPMTIHDYREQLIDGTLAMMQVDCAMAMLERSLSQPEPQPGISSPSGTFSRDEDGWDARGRWSAEADHAEHLSAAALKSKKPEDHAAAAKAHRHILGLIKTSRSSYGTAGVEYHLQRVAHHDRLSKR